MRFSGSGYAAAALLTVVLVNDAFDRLAGSGNNVLVTRTQAVRQAIVNFTSRAAERA